MSHETTQLTPEKLARLLNKQLATRPRKGSFFFPQFNGPDDPYGLKAFDQGDLGVSEKFVEAASKSTKSNRKGNLAKTD